MHVLTETNTDTLQTVERKVNEHTGNNKDSLKSAIIRVMSSMNQDHLTQAHKQFDSYIEVVIEAGGNFIGKCYQKETFFFIIKLLSVII